MLRQIFSNQAFLLILLVLAAIGYFAMAILAPSQPGPQDIEGLAHMLEAGLRKLPWYIYLSMGIAVAIFSHLINDATWEKLFATIFGTVILIYLLALPEFFSMYFDVNNMCGERLSAANQEIASCGDLWLGLIVMYGFTLLLWGYSFVVPVVIAVTFVHVFLITLVAVCRGTVPAWKSLVATLK